MRCKHEWEGRTDGSYCIKCGRYAGEIFEPTSNVLTIHFSSVDDASEFKVWLSESGEQSFMEWGEYQDTPTYYAFEYHTDGDEVHIRSTKEEEEPDEEELAYRDAVDGGSLG